MLRPDYGLDAPAVVRNLCLAGIACLAVALLIKAGVLSGAITFSNVRIIYTPAACGAGFSLLATGLWMLWSGKIGKTRDRDRVLDLHSWRGDERVLDLGCGRGLMLIGCAQRLRTGLAVGVDKWQTEDLAGNRPGAPLDNARLERVAGRVRTTTGDMRALPFQNAAFDLIVSRAAIHNVYDANERETAVREIVRVLKPGSEALLEDIRHGPQYAAILREAGCAEVRELYPALLSLAWAALTFGSLRPTLLRARKNE
jgi:SAM-dependent methyltransferase